METVLTRPTTLGSLEVPEAARQQARETIQALPPTTFSELLRCLDPVTSISKWVEPSDGLYVDRAAMERTTLGGEFEAYGIRKIYGDLIVCVMGLVSLRWKAGHRPTVEDFHVLLRCAGAASQLSKAKKIWHMMEDAGLAGQRNGRSYAEFAKARFLTEPLYTQYDKSRCRVRPIDLANVKSGMSLSRRALRTLRLMRYKEMESQTHGAGMVPFGAGMRRITRSLRWPVPVKKMWATMMRGDLVLDESNVCAAIVALGRAGSLQFMEREILWRLYLIRVERPGSGNVVVKGGRVEMQAHSPLRPTVKLLEAIVEAYCSNAEVARGLKVVDLLSRRYAIPMPAKLWFDVLEWAYVQASLPASQEWRVAGWPGKSLNQDSVQMIWDTMTQAPYNVEPGFRQYQILVNMLLSRNRLRQAMAYMLDLEPFYRSLLPELEDAFGTEAEARALGVATQTAASVRAGAMGWDAQRARKDLVFSIFQGWVHALLRRVRGRHPAGDALTTVLVPQLVAAFRAVLPPTVAYRVATGKVEMANAASVRHRVRYVLERRRRPLTVKGDAVSPSFFRHDRFGKRRMAEQWLKVVHVPRLVTRPLDPGALLRRAPRPLDLERQFT
ncbi:hypothetical protein P8C59_002777 [Phyllachora maydis]|uniref:Uncharacterized protein n=1 Tax=Phyllachora maydis TaxID=1825666 RepID=A0AAD9M8C7_9PEZI|nr:hypothetical protein P8C59_002777 [Phyllachora maydis]